MARVQLIIPDDDWSRFVHQARMEGMTFSAWLREAAREKLEDRQKGKRFDTSKKVQEFFQACDSRGDQTSSRIGASMCASSNSRAPVVGPGLDLRRYERLHVCRGKSSSFARGRTIFLSRFYPVWHTTLHISGGPPRVDARIFASWQGQSTGRGKNVSIQFRSHNLATGGGGSSLGPAASQPASRTACKGPLPPRQLSKARSAGDQNIR